MEADNYIAIAAIVVPLMTGIIVVAVMVGKHIQTDASLQVTMEREFKSQEESRDTFRKEIRENFQEVKDKQDHTNGTLSEHGVTLGRHHERMKNLELIEERRNSNGR